MRVAVTVARTDAKRVARIAQQAGLEAVEAPCIEVEPCIEPGAVDTSGADWIVVTSARAVELVWPDTVPSVPFIAVGPRTADAVKERGGHVAIESAGTVDAMVDDLATAVQSGAHVVFPRADGAAPTTSDQLRRQGAIVYDPVVYRVRSIAPPPDPVDAVAFGSPSAVRGWIMSRRLSDLFVGAIGPTTAAAVIDAGGAVDAQPSRPTFSDLFEAIGALT